MRIIPVIDLMGGQVVRGVAGRRETYRPVNSILTAESSAAAVAGALAESFDFDRCYLADLDAIAGAEPAWETYRAIMSRGMQLWIDAGLTDVARAKEMAEFLAGEEPIERIIVGLESISRCEMLSSMLNVVGRDRLMFSLDLMDGRPLTKIDDWRQLDVKTILRRVVATGIRRVIVLDLAQVGMGAGVPTLALCRRIRAEFPDLEIITGGGVAGPHDVVRLREARCDAALVSSALHDGRIRRADVAAMHSK